MHEDLTYFFLGHAVLQRSPRVHSQLIGAIQRCQGRDGDQASVALGEARALLYISAHQLSGQLT